MKHTVVVILLSCSCAGPPSAQRPADTAEVAVETFEGTVAARQGEPGSKSEGEQWLVLIVGDDTFELENPGELKAGDTVAVRARRVTRSPYAAHRPGPRLMVVDVVRR